MTFDDVLPTLLRVCETWEHAEVLREVAVVRDLRGRIRLAVDTTEEGSSHIAVLRVLLGKALGEWFADEVLSTREGEEVVRNIARRILKAAPPWKDARYPDELGGEKVATAKRWKLLERRVGKIPWLEGEATPPWPPRAEAPTVVTFYSFKGGVGRTTTLAACALLAAQAGESVVVVDLDLEAPGAGSLFGIDDTPRGVLDLLVDHLATGKVDLQDALHTPRELPDELATYIHVIPAGRLDRRYLEKLARLDFTGSAVEAGAPSSPVHDALRAVLKKVRAEKNPRWIFLDARAGLHDLAGLSLHGLAHVDVVFSRANTQGLAGLDLVLNALAQRQRDAASHTVLVHAMAPASKEEARNEHGDMSKATHKMFMKYGLFLQKTPEQTVDDSDHWPWTLRREEAIERNTLKAIVRQLTGDDYSALWRRLGVVTGAVKAPS